MKKMVTQFEKCINEVGWKEERGHKSDGSSDSNVLLADNVKGYIDIIWCSN